MVCHNFSECSFHPLALEETWLSLKHLASPTTLSGAHMVASNWISSAKLEPCSQNSLPGKALGKNWQQEKSARDLESRVKWQPLCSAGQ